ncbi:NAD(P)-dependent oxidoreductase [Pararhizobium mangrovi]|uniref:NAD(P)-dependent oxidoreductase n=1 Tax=Pararhizobium mangrovi TaxID=2590452 RepID=A0A506U7N0_9HYPH|nr:NAD(P)-dependent oxidoreductase [Pararhizobium mangrovi]TPW28965.1 NAD(P)-dependent oxidoreductase [Pararhizobium mangrovi]
MTTESVRDVAAGRLQSADYLANFADLHAPMTPHEAIVEADRCYFCYDAPCMNACPTTIDIPLFIREIAAGNADGAAKTILSQNIMGGMCARVCPTETLCEEVCVRETAEGKPVRIGELQRYATDHLMERHTAHPFKRAAQTGKRVAVVGAGPAGMACAHRLARFGHDVTIFEARPKAGGLNEYGIAAYKTPGDFAQRELDFILEIGGITVKNETALGRDVTLEALSDEFDAIFLGMGLGGVNDLGLEGDDAEGCIDAVKYIADLRQAKDKAALSIGRRVVVIGGGMTAVDIAIQSRLLGAEDVTICYRRGREAMNASEYEQELAQTNGVTIRPHLMPKLLERGADGAITGIVLEYGEAGPDGKLVGTGETLALPADQVFKAIGQSPVTETLSNAGIELEAHRIKVSDEGRTSHPKIWAGGDCVRRDDDLTVVAVDHGQRAAQSIHAALSR